ncbi:hypothetical protein [Streptomyces tsukubensis]|uniref:hypothetical protein n=1 Tax=Streptomyces tsukubensis TaxID=83656 RepID=UPI00344D715F
MRINNWTGTVECSDCRVDLGGFPNDYSVGPEEDVYCGHCEFEGHECRMPDVVEGFLRRAFVWNQGDRDQLTALALLEEMSTYAQRELPVGSTERLVAA